MLALVDLTQSPNVIQQVFPNMNLSRDMQRSGVMVGDQGNGTTIIAVREQVLPDCPMQISVASVDVVGAPGTIMNYGRSLGVPSGWIAAACNTPSLINTVIANITTADDIASGS
jgi:hypothetical protein